VRQVPATAPRKNTEFLRIVREPSRCQLRPTPAEGMNLLFSAELDRQPHTSFLVLLRPQILTQRRFSADKSRYTRSAAAAKPESGFMSNL
jgi:hypothetical protein